MATWQGRKPLDRGGVKINPGDTFEPTEAERAAFADCIADEASGFAEPDMFESSPESTPPEETSR